MRGIDQVIEDPSTSSWMRQALAGALVRDPVDTANDAHVLKQLLEHRADAMFATAAGSGCTPHTSPSQNQVTPLRYQDSSRGPTSNASLYLYYPGRRQVPSVLKAFIGAVKALA